MQIFCKLYSRIIYCDNKTSSADVTTTADYLVGFVYKSKSYSSPELSELAYSKKLQFFSHEEGRVRPLEGNNETPFVYDYFIKDHLGNVRMVLTEEEKQDKYPVASLEDSKIEIEKNYYGINTSNVADKSEAIGITDYVNDNGIGNNPEDETFSQSRNAKLYKLNSNTAKTGLGITLKVMAGDRIDVFGKSYYFENTSGTGSNSPITVLDLLNSFLNTPAAAGTTHGITGPDLNNTVNLPGINSMISQQSSQSNAAPNKPRAFINVIFFDEQFKSYNFKLSMAGEAGIIKEHFSELQNIAAAKNGYVYIYCSNESPVNVFFDNLQVVHTRGALLEETHYYPFGLTMAGISSKAASFGSPENKFKYNGIEHNTDFDLNTYEAFYRTHDPQIGRWWQIDPKSEASLNLSPYVAMDNNPILKSDPLGDIAIIDDAVIGFFKGLFGKRNQGTTRFGNALRSAGRHAANSAKIYGGLFTSDRNRSFLGQVGQILSRFTWQLPNTAVGFTTAHGANMIGNVNSVEHEAGATVLNYGNKEFGAFTIGSFIIGDKTIKADPNNSLFQHEYGHYLQSETFGPAYLFAFAIPSVISAGTHDYYGHMNYYTEIGASTRTHNYFNRTIPGYNGWDYDNNPVKPDAIQRAIEQRNRDMPRIGDAGPADKQLIDVKDRKN